MSASVGSAALGLPGPLPPAPRGLRGAPVSANKGTNVYVSRLPRAVTQQQLEALFQPFGPIMSCRVVYHTQGRQGRVPRDPVGFVQFLSPGPPPPPLPRRLVPMGAAALYTRGDGRMFMRQQESGLPSLSPLSILIRGGGLLLAAS